MPTTLERLSTILARDYKLAPDRLTADAPLEDLGIDSLGTVDLLWNIEDAFGITLPSEPENLRTLGDVIRLVDALVAARAAAAGSCTPDSPALRAP